jgi:hypothetical protein
MKRSTVEKKLNDAMARRSSALGDEAYYTRDIDYHDSEASRIRKRRQAARNKRDRADAAIAKLNKLLSTDIVL